MRKINDYPDVSLTSEELDGRLNFKDIFGRNGAVHLEIGSGKGTFLVHQAKAQPGVNFLGIEWANKYYCHAVDRIGRWGLDNVRITRADAAQFLREHVADESLDCLHLYFPDPWPKKRHHKRRFFNAKNMDEVLRCLVPGGRVNVATDHAGYFSQMEEVTQGLGDRIERVEFVRAAGAEDGEMVGTNYERKYAEEGRQTFTLAFLKAE
ncbi:tRNA (guanine-N(7)-)-methyltransferase [Anaerohalosphaera lusitana]|uniref:tRNA (guanine-N(7)-)-methyltransferase n=1 Tax=Anaerohalosphaera lusitana TaxID=1936003 RepID=A0A1U9NKD4_9BACT|nr:tRNA (guanosine(46)-N7)-methyltransferase TrmB [Anaerohalosphaera lusitana]AQT68050.1 tRNA (guanine-N(7)-)-methyltransferase [Anaerohalosphaera lusitana]